MSAKDHREKHNNNGIGLRIKEWMLWAEKRNPSTHNLTRMYSPQDIAKHNTKNDLWVVVDGIVYDVTLFSMYHPGGKSLLLNSAGKDVTAEYNRAHAWVEHETILKSYIVGSMLPDDTSSTQPAAQPAMTSQASPTPSSTPTQNFNVDEKKIMQSAMGCGLFQATTELQREAMVARVGGPQQAAVEEEESLGALFDEIDSQRTGYILRSQVEQIINSLNDGSPMDGVTMQRLQSIRSELINRKQFVLLFL
eukprot:PhF_6_TR36550/c1_g1_i1/m.53928